MITTSYKSEGLEQLLTYLPLAVEAKSIIEFGTQHGHSAILLSMGGAKVTTYDSFMETYSEPPYKQTHANFKEAQKNTKHLNITIKKRDVFKLKPIQCDVLHIDICNHLKNVKPLIDKWEKTVKKMIILEGGVYNKWQKKYNFKPYIPDLKDWNYIIVEGENGYAMTILTRI